MTDNIAPAGRIWVCGACGKTALDKYGEDRGWDESCMLNAVLCYENKSFGPSGIYGWVVAPEDRRAAVSESRDP